MKKQCLRVGFDLDGVLLYNPARIFRPMIVFIKKYLLKRDLNKFYYPKSRFEQLLWFFLHKSSVWPAPGITELKKVVKEKKIKAYIISARYESLEKDFEKWIKIIDPEKQFSGYFYNDKNEQPYLFKEKMIKKLKLDIFVEDNWDIVKKLNLKLKNKKSKVYWIYNIFDKRIKYQYKFPTLIKIVEKIKSNK
jgi:hypothetical protein